MTHSFREIGPSDADVLGKVACLQYEAYQHQLKSYQQLVKSHGEFEKRQASLGDETSSQKWIEPFEARLVMTLTDEGALNPTQHRVEFMELLIGASKLQHKTLCCAVFQKTLSRTPDVAQTFVADHPKVVGVLKQWLDYARRLSNLELTVELLTILKDMVVDAGAIRKYEAVQLVKKLKYVFVDTPKVRTAVSSLLKKWKTVLQTNMSSAEEPARKKASVVVGKSAASTTSSGPGSKRAAPPPDKVDVLKSMLNSNGKLAKTTKPASKRLKKSSSSDIVDTSTKSSAVSPVLPSISRYSDIKKTTDDDVAPKTEEDERVDDGKKRIRWKDDHGGELEEVQFFDVEDRINPEGTAAQNFAKKLQGEKEAERQQWQKHNREYTVQAPPHKWRLPPVVMLPLVPDTVLVGPHNTDEVERENERIATKLRVFYSEDSQIPPSPEEPPSSRDRWQNSKPPVNIPLLMADEIPKPFRAFTRRMPLRRDRFWGWEEEYYRPSIHGHPSGYSSHDRAGQGSTINVGNAPKTSGGRGSLPRGSRGGRGGQGRKKKRGGKLGRIA